MLLKSTWFLRVTEICVSLKFVSFLTIAAPTGQLHGPGALLDLAPMPRSEKRLPGAELQVLTRGPKLQTLYTYSFNLTHAYVAGTNSFRIAAVPGLGTALPDKWVGHDGPWLESLAPAIAPGLGLLTYNHDINSAHSPISSLLQHASQFLHALLNFIEEQRVRLLEIPKDSQIS